MRFWISIFLAALVSVTPAFAAERVLLTPDGTAATPAAAVSLQGLRQAARTKGVIKVIVGLKVPFAAEGNLPGADRIAQRQDIATAAAKLRNRFAGAADRRPGALRTFSALPFAALEVNAAELDRLAADPLVVSISEDRKLRLNLADSAPLIRAPQAWTAGFTGLGQTIAIIDSGVDKYHPLLAGKVVSEACYSTGRICPGGTTASTEPGSGLPCHVGEDCAHGTHVAGIAAGLGNPTSGIARDAKLIAIQVFSPDSDYPGEIVAWSSDLLAGLNRVYDLRGLNVAAVNMSLGSGIFTRSCDGYDPSMTAAIANLRSAGIATVIAAGNDGWTNAISFPACVAGAISVGSVSDGNWGPCSGRPTATDKIACYSNSASFLSLLAPGSAITSSIPGGGYETWHGTSMAAPHVAGAWAVVKQKVPNATVADVLSAFQKTGRMISDDRMPKRPTVRPRIDVAAAISQFVTLGVSKMGTGDGTLSVSTPGGTAACNGSCSIATVAGTTVTVTATPATGSILSAWSGACSGAGACTFVITSSTAVVATFSPVPVHVLSYTAAGTGTGSVTFSPDGGSGTCTATCAQRYTQGTVVRLSAIAGTRSRFAGWSGACRGSKSCVVTMSAAKSVSARFVAR